MKLSSITTITFAAVLFTAANGAGDPASGGGGPPQEGGGGGANGGGGGGQRPPGADGPQRPAFGLPRWLPQCFESSSSPLTMVECIQDHLPMECYNETTIQGEILTCLHHELNGTLAPEEVESHEMRGNHTRGNETVRESIRNATEYCLEDYLDCVEDNINHFVGQLEPCMNQTVRALGACAAANRDTCETSCDGALEAIQGSYDDINPVTLATCNGIQTQIMDSSCEAISCCEPCIDEYEALMNCMVNDVLAYTAQPCDLSCEERRLRHRVLEQETPSFPRAEAGFAACMETVPGLTGDDTTEFAYRAPVFLECLGDEMETVLTVTSDTTLGPTSAPTTAADGGDNDSSSPVLNWAITMLLASAVGAQFVL
eukprot:Nitzschia sp. Nitz4//scaffold95_size97785//37325//38440//NITZ4_004663-RA/size97785-processed-gene-0.11-mRNA-1//1//CDS//3329560460//1493//frame0